MSETRISFRYLSEPDAIAAGVTDMPGCVDAMEAMFTTLGAGDYRMAGNEGNSHGAMISFPASSPFPNMPVDGVDRRFMAMPAYLGGTFDLAGVKWYGSNIENRHKGQPRSIHLFVLNDKDTGAPLMAMSANLLSAYRTGAVPGVGARYLAKPDSRVAAIIGPGVMGKTGLEAFAAVCPNLESVQVLGRGQAAIDDFVAWTKETFPALTVKVCHSMQEAVAGADVINVGTSSPSGSSNYPYLAEKWLSPGAFVSAVGMVRFDEDFLLERSYNAVDYSGLYRAWTEEYGYPLWETIGLAGCQLMDLVTGRRLEASTITDISDLIAGTAPLPADDAVRVFGVGGMPVEDIAWASKVYQNALERGIGTDLLLWDSPAMA
jgi:ornithine cyclodeaminase